MIITQVQLQKASSSAEVFVPCGSSWVPRCHYGARVLSRWSLRVGSCWIYIYTYTTHCTRPHMPELADKKLVYVCDRTGSVGIEICITLHNIRWRER